MKIIIDDCKLNCTKQPNTLTFFSRRIRHSGGLLKTKKGKRLQKGVAQAHSTVFCAFFESITTMLSSTTTVDASNTISTI